MRFAIYSVRPPDLVWWFTFKVEGVEGEQSIGLWQRWYESRARFERRRAGKRTDPRHDIAPAIDRDRPDPESGRERD